MLIILGFILSLLLYSSSCTPDCPYTFNRIKINDKTLHVHHWLISLLLLFIFKNEFMRGLLLGGVYHGIVSYDDWYKIYY